MNGNPIEGLEIDVADMATNFSPSLLSACGAIVLVCSAIDDVISKRIFKLAGVTEQVGFILIGQMPISNKLKRLKLLTEIKDPSDLAHFSEVSVALDKLFKIRNHIAHGVCPGKVPGTDIIVFVVTSNIDVDENQVSQKAFGWSEKDILCAAELCGTILNDLEKRWGVPLVGQLAPPRGNPPARQQKRRASGDQKPRRPPPRSSPP